MPLIAELRADELIGSTLNENLQVWTRRKEELQSLQLSRPSGVSRISQTLIITQEIGVILRVTVSRFHPEPNDATGYAWHDSEGNTQIMEMPPYYISDMSQALVNIQEYGDLSCSLYIQSLLDGTNPIIWKTFQAAYNYVAFSQVCFYLSAPRRRLKAKAMLEHSGVQCVEILVSYTPHRAYLAYLR